MNPRSLPDYVLVVPIVVLVLVSPATVWTATGSNGPNLLTNPGCEGGDATNAPSGWTSVTSDLIECADPAPWGGPSAKEGNQSFIDAANDGGSPIIEQTVSVTSNSQYAISGWVGSFGSASDYVRIEVDYLDASDTVLSGGKIRHDAYNGSGGSFVQFSNSSVAPSNAAKATIRIKLVNVDGGYADGIVDGLDFHSTSSAPTANDVDGLSVDISGTLTESVHDDFGFGADDLGSPAGAVVSFGGGDLGGTVTDHAANSTTTLAGGDLTLYDNGTLELVGPTQNGTYTFDYRLQNGVGSDDATVTIDVVDNSSFAISTTNANESVLEGQTWSADVTVENVGTNVGTQNVTLSIENETGTTVHQDEQEVSLTAGATDTITFGWTPADGSAGSYDAIVSTADDSTTLNVTVFGYGTIEGRVVDPNTNQPAEVAIENATVTVRYPNGSVAVATTNATGDFAVANIPATGESYTIDVGADGYTNDTSTVTVSTDHTDAGTITLDGTAEISGTIRDAATGAGLAGANVSATAGAGSYEATTSADGTYTITPVPGGQVYDVTVTAAGYSANVTTGQSVADGATYELNASLSGNATVEGVVENNATGGPVENASVTVVYPDTEEFTVENATDANGNFSIAGVPGTDESYEIVVHEPGFEDATKSVTVGDGATVDAGTLLLLGNASVAGTVEDETFFSGVGGVTVNVSNGQYAFETVTDGTGAFLVEDVPGGESYDVVVDEAGWETNSTTIAVGDGESVTGETIVLVGSDQLDATVYDEFLAENSTDDGLLDGATVTIEHATLGSVTRTTDSSGVVGPVSVPAGATYNVTASMSGYDSYTNASVPNGSSVEILLAGNATIDGTVTDELTGDALENATVTIEYPTGVNATVVNATDATGAYAIDAVPGTGETYAVTASLAGYRNETATTAVADGGTVTVDLEMLPAGEATVSGTVTDQRTGSAIENANVTVELDDSSAPGATIVYNGTTASDGTYEFVDVIGGYDYNVSIVADGYENASTVEPVSENGTTVIDLTLAGNASISGTIVDSLFGVSLENASVTAVGSQGEYAATTDAGGSYTIDRVPGTGESYAVTVRADGYEANDTTVSLGGVGDGTGVNLTLVGNATIVATVTDGVTSQPIGVDANVTVENATVGEATAVGVSPTGADEYRVSVPGTGLAYNVTIDVAGYEAGTQYSTTAIGSGGQASIAETLLGATQLTGTIADSASGQPIGNATVTATGPAGTYTNETAQDGTYVIENVPGTGESYDVAATARAYQDNDTSVTVPEAGTTVDLDLVKRVHFLGIESFDVPAEVEKGDQFDATVTIANLGSATWNDSVELVVDGSVVANESIELDAGNDSAVVFEHAFGTKGTYDIQVRTANETENASIDVVARSSSSHSQPRPPSSSDDDSGNGDADESVLHEEVGVIERDDQSGRSSVHFSGDSTVDWIVFDEHVSGTVTLAELVTNSTETSGSDETTDSDPSTTVAVYRIDVPTEAEDVPATIRLWVSRDRLAELDAEPTDVFVHRFSDGEWQRLETTVVTSDEAGALLEARTPGFSTFAVRAVSEPEAAIRVDPERAVVGEEITLSGLDSTNRFGEIVSYEWTIDGRTIDGETATVTFEEAGDYRVELTVVNADGESDTATVTLGVTGSMDESETPTETPGADETPTETTSDGQPGFGVLLAGFAVLGAALLVRRR